MAKNQTNATATPTQPDVLTAIAVSETDDHALAEALAALDPYVIAYNDGEFQRGEIVNSPKNTDGAAVLNVVLGRENANVAVGQELMESPARGARAIPVTVMPRIQSPASRVGGDSSQPSQPTAAAKPEASHMITITPADASSGDYLADLLGEKEEPDTGYLAGGPKLMQALDYDLSYANSGTTPSHHGVDSYMPFLSLFAALTEAGFIAMHAQRAKEGHEVFIMYDSGGFDGFNQRQEQSIHDLLDDGYLRRVPELQYKIVPTEKAKDAIEDDRKQRANRSPRNAPKPASEHRQQSDTKPGQLRTGDEPDVPYLAEMPPAVTALDDLLSWCPRLEEPDDRLSFYMPFMELYYTLSEPRMVEIFKAGSGYGIHDRGCVHHLNSGQCRSLEDLIDAGYMAVHDDRTVRVTAKGIKAIQAERARRADLSSAA